MRTVLIITGTLLLLVALVIFGRKAWTGKMGDKYRELWHDGKLAMAERKEEQRLRDEAQGITA